jgi:hypothetical protein
MKKTFSLMLGACALALTTFTSCHDHDNVFDESSEMNSGTALTVEGAVEGLNTTRATDTAWETGDSIGLISTDLAANVKYVTTGGNGKFSAADADVYFTDRSDHVFYAYYPYSSKVNENCWYFSVSDSANVAAQKRNDIMVASGTATASNPTLQLQFKHAMARLIINVKTSTEDGFDADDVFSDNCSAMIGSTITRCMLNVTSSTVSAVASRAIFTSLPPPTIVKLMSVNMWYIFRRSQVASSPCISIVVPMLNSVTLFN